MANLLSVAEAAKRLTAAGDKIDRSGLSRYLTRHASALPTVKESGRLTLVDLDALVSHRRAHLGKGPPIKKDTPRAAREPAATDALSLADEQQGKLRADRLLAADRLAKRKVDLVSRLAAEGIAASAVIAMKLALDTAAGETAALIAAERGGDVDVIRTLLLDQGRPAGRAMEMAVQKAGFLSMTAEAWQDMVALLPAAEPEPPEPQNLDEERAAKARMDRLRQELTLLERRRVMIPRQEAEFALIEALELAKQALATSARDGIEALARAVGVEPVFVRPYPRQHERRVLALFQTELRRRACRAP